MCKTSLLFSSLLPILVYSARVKPSESPTGNRSPKLFVNVVVDPMTCLGVDGKTFGICTTTKGCSRENSKEIGTCSSGGAVCCQVTIIPSPSSKNVTIVTDPAVTIGSSGVANSNSVVEFPKQQNVCQLKVIFGQTRLEPPSTDPLRYGECIRDSITISGTTSFATDSLTVCGPLTDQHMYLSYGLATTTPSEKITMVIKTKSRLAQVSINVVQIKCNSPDIVPDTCLQRVTGNTGRVRSFGFPYQLINQDYKVCTQRIPGVTGIEWKECSNTGGRIKPFFVTGIAAMSGDPVPLQEGNIFCSHDHVQLGSIESGLTTLKKCGGTFPKTLVPGASGLLAVFFDGDEVGSSTVVTNLPPSLLCSAILVSGHDCRSVISGGEPICICTLHPDIPSFITLKLDILPEESCPTVQYYECVRTGNSCECILLYDEADDKNTGFCLEYTNIF